jgi:hypothetical protein
LSDAFVGKSTAHRAQHAVFAECEKAEPSTRVSERGKKGIGYELAGWDWHPLKGPLAGRWPVSVSGNWRLTYAFENGDAIH